MDKLPIMHGRLKFFEGRLDIFNEYNNRFIEGELSSNEYWDFLTAIDGVISYYWRYIRRYYKLFKNKSLIMPLDGFKQGKADGFINDADCWLEYIEDLNALFNIKDDAFYEQKLLEFIDFYRNKIPLTLECMHSPENMEMLEACEPVVQEYMKKPINLAENKPIYSETELGITKASYDIIIDYFKSNPNIKNVWVHGSRMIGTNSKGSDIDFVIDCPEEDMKEIENKIENLPIPYFCDFSNINSKKDAFFIKTIVDAGNKKIYCSDDFNQYWTSTNYTQNIKYNISSIFNN